MKIHIIGASGSGKSYLAEKLSKKFNIPHYDLDDIEWKRKYDIENEPEIKNKLLNQILSNNDWIIEGVYHTWCEQCFKDADKIYILNTPANICKIRIIKRYIKRLLKIEQGSNSSIKSLIELIKWVDTFHKDVMPEIKNSFKIYKNKITEL